MPRRRRCETAIAACHGRASARLIDDGRGRSAAILEFQLADAGRRGADRAGLRARSPKAQPADDAWRRGHRCRDRRLRGVRRRLFPRPRRRSQGHPRPGAARADRRAATIAAPAGAILFGDDIAPTRFLETDWSAGGGIALTAGSTASHVAMLARSRGVPMVVGLGACGDRHRRHGAARRRAWRHRARPDRRRRSRASAAPSHAFGARRALADDFLLRSAATKAGTAVRVQVNIADPSDVDAHRHRGLRRRRPDAHRIPVRQGPGLPDEETQYAAYRKVLEWAGGKPVTIRTVDAGGDKPVPGFTVEESNPFLGLRGIRLSLARPEIFRVQIRALLRAARARQSEGDVPDDRRAEEYDRAAALFAEEARELARAGRRRTRCRRSASWSRCRRWRSRRKRSPTSPSSRSAPTI